MPAASRNILMLSVLAGMLVSTLQRGSFRLDWRPQRSWLRNIFGGALMGLGAAMVPGGNAALILYAIPSFSLHALPAFAALIVGAGAGLLAMKHFAGLDTRVVCRNDIYRAEAQPKGSILNSHAPRNELKRLRHIHPPVIKRAAGDGAGEFLGARLQQRLDVVDRGQAAGGDHRNRNRVGQRDGGVEIETFEQTVARDVGIDDGGNAGVLEAARDRERREFGDFRPALHRHLAVARIEPDRDAAGKFLAPRRSPAKDCAPPRCR